MKHGIDTELVTVTNTIIPVEQLPLQKTAVFVLSGLKFVNHRCLLDFIDITFDIMCARF